MKNIKLANCPYTDATWLRLCIGAFAFKAATNESRFYFTA